MKKILLLLTFLIVFANILSAEELSKEKQAEKYFLEGVEAINQENYEKAIVLFDRAIALDTNRTEFAYEKALAHYQKGSYSRCIHILDSLKKTYDAEEVLFRLMGNAYQMIQKSYKARKIYEEGLVKYPMSGSLHFEMGVLELGKKREFSALQYWTKGAALDPYFTDNYFMLAVVYNEIGGLMKSILYGEMYINLTNNTGRIKLVSEYIKHDYDSLLHGLSFVTSYAKPSPKDILKSFDKRDSTEAFQGLYLNFFDNAAQQILKEKKKLTIAELIQIRSSIAMDWYSSGANLKYPSSLIEFHSALIQEGLFEVYNYLLFAGALQDEAAEYLKKNSAKLQKFQKWLPNYDFNLSYKNNFTIYLVDPYRKDYEK
jgi:anaphase-promoting complex subunit 3